MDFRILGPLEIRQNGRALPCKGAKQRLLLAALLLHANEVVSSDRLIDALWGDNPPATATKALQMHISQLRRLLAPDILVTRPPGYELRVADDELDLERFDTAVRQARTALGQRHLREAADLLASALAMWRGPPLADLSFEEFLQPEIARLEELRLAALEDRIEADLALGRHGELVAELEALAVEHPLRERIHAQLMTALYRCGRQADALGVYRETRRRLVDELGLEPNRELKALEERILAQDPELDLPRTPSALPGRDRLIGRQRELADLLPIVDAAIAGRGAVIAIAGEPGIGKSRLAESLARHAERSSAQVAIGRCWEAGGAPPFWPWVQALQDLRQDAPAELAELLGKPGAATEEDPGARFRMFAAVGAFLGGAAARAPLALFLDDIHAADAASLLLLRFLAAQLTTMPVLVVTCFRDTEVGPELAETLNELGREPVFRRVALGGLDTDGTSELLAAAIGTEPDGELVARVQAETRGNPLFAVEIGRLVAETHADTAVERLPIPDGVREAIRQRLQRQSEACREFLVLASVLGREFDLAAISLVGEIEEDALLAAVGEASAARLIGNVPGTNERLRFSHILVRDVLYDDLPAPARLRLHRAVGEALEGLYAGNPAAHAAELAHHFVSAGRLAPEKAADYAQLAGDTAAAQYAYEEGARYYSLALELVERQTTADPRRVCDLLLSLGDVHSRAGSGASAKDALQRAAAIADEHGWNERLVRAAVGYGGRFAWVRASTHPALVPLLERALAVVGNEDARSRARLLARLAAAIRDDPSRERRVAIAEEAVALGRQSGDPVALAYALEGFGVSTEGIEPAIDIRTANELIKLGEQLGDKERIFTGRDFRLNALLKLSDRAGVDVEIEALARLSEELNQPAQRWSVAIERVIVALMEGRFDEAEQRITETRAAGEGVESWNARVSATLQVFVLRRAQGRLAEIEDVMKRAVHEYPMLVRFRCALAHLHAELGDERAARSALADVHAHDLGYEYRDAEWLFTLALLPGVYRFLGDADAAGTLYSILEPHAELYTQAPSEVSFGSVAGGLGVLATTTGSYEDAERHLEAAIEIERRMGARPWVAHAQHDLASMHLQAGDRAAARLRAEQAVSSYRELGMDSWAERAEQLR